LFVIALVWYRLKNKNLFFSKLLGYVGILIAIAAIVITVLAGHSGASASWGYKIKATNSSSQQ
jgi:hypothetical protein